MTDWRRPAGGDDVWLPIGLAVLVVGGALAGAAYLFDHGTKEPQSAAVKSSSPTAPARPPAAAPATAVPTPQAAPAPQGGLVFRCQVNGRVEYRDSPCERGGRTVDTASSSGVRLADPRRLYAEPQPAEAAPVQAQVAAAPARSSNKGECPLIEQQIANLDAAARQPLSPEQQDSIRKQLTAAKTRWANLKCHSPIE